MNLLIIFFIWYAISGRNNPDIYNRIGKVMGKIVAALVLFSVFSVFLPILIPLSFIGLFFWLIGWSFKKLFGKDTPKQNRVNSNTGKKARYTDLTRAVPKRQKIVRKFSEKYNLNLTQEEIERIVDASYMSYGWENEICAMNQSYDSVSEWYGGENNWLRAYLRVFPVQSVSSDFNMQMQICLDVFERVFNEKPPKNYSSIDACIADYNNTYMTAFDEATFMIAYRFLQQNGRRFELPKVGILRNESELDRLMGAYDRMAKNSESMEGRGQGVMQP